MLLISESLRKRLEFFFRNKWPLYAFFREKQFFLTFIRFAADFLVFNFIFLSIKI